MVKRKLDFKEFLISLISVPMKIKNKELAEIFGVSDSVISKIKNGKMVNIPVNMRPLTKAEGFARAVVEKFSPTAATVETFRIYARHLDDTYAVSEHLHRKITAVMDFDSNSAGAEETAADMLANEVPSFLACLYNEAYTNTASSAGGNPAPAVLLKPSRESFKNYDKICRDVGDDRYDKNELHNMFVAIGQKLYGGPMENIIHTDLYSLFYGMIFREKNSPYFDYSRRKENFSVRTREDGKIELTRTVDILEQIVLGGSHPYEYVFMERLTDDCDIKNIPVLKQHLQNFSCKVDDIPVQEYVNLHRNNNYTTPYEMFYSRPIGVEELVSTHRWLELSFFLYPGETKNVHRIETRYTYRIVLTEANLLRNNFRLPLSCRFMEHEFHLDDATKEHFGLKVDMFTPFYYDSNLARESPIKQKRIYVNATSGFSGGRVTFYDWALPGSGYSVYLFYK